MLESYEEELRASRSRPGGGSTRHGEEYYGYAKDYRYEKPRGEDYYRPYGPPTPPASVPPPNPHAPPGSQYPTTSPSASPYPTPPPPEIKGKSGSAPEYKSDSSRQTTGTASQPTTGDSKERKDEPYLTFPGYYDSSYSGYGPPGPGTGMGMPPQYYPPYYPMFYPPRRPMDAFGAAGVTFATIAMCLFWLSVFPEILGTMIFVVVVCLGGLGIIFGGYGFASKKRRSIGGLVGAIVGIVAIVLGSIFWSYTHIIYYYS
jgi:hypothetical protein